MTAWNASKPISPVDVAQLALSGGLSDMQAAYAVAVSKHEGGWRTDALNDNPRTGDYSVGLWQINYAGTLRPGRTARYGSPTQLRDDVARQVKAMVEISGKGTNWEPFRGSKSITQADLRQGAKAVAQAKLNGPDKGGIGGVLQDIGNISPSDAYNSFINGPQNIAALPGKWLSNIGTGWVKDLFSPFSGSDGFAIRGMEILGGAFLMAGGIVILIKVVSDTTGATGAIEKGATAYATGGTSALTGKATGFPKTTKIFADRRATKGLDDHPLAAQDDLSRRREGRENRRRYTELTSESNF